MTQTILPVIKGRFQSFVKDDYPNFAKFMGDYFKWLEQDNNFLQIVNDWRSNTEPSNNVEPYITAILEDVGFDINQDISIPKSTLLHFMKDFYLARGSTQSFEFLFRVLFADDTIKIRYPRENLLIPSYAEYGEKFYVYLSANNVGSRDYLAILQNLTELSGTLTGLTSKVVVSVESITPILGNSKTYLEIEILKSIGDFIVGENVSLTVGDNQIVEVIQNVSSVDIHAGGSGYQLNDPVIVSHAQITSNGYVSKISSGGIDSLTITSAGTGYTVGDLILARNVTNQDGSGFSAQVSAVGNNGELQSYIVLCPGYGYTILPEITVKRQETGTFTDAIIEPLSSQIGSIQNITFLGANVDFDETATVEVSSITGTGGSLILNSVSTFGISDWDNDRGFIGENSTIIDSDKYQQYSYEIISSISPSRYLTIVDDLLHPVGYVRSAVIEIESSVVLNTPKSTSSGSIITDITFLSDSPDDDFITSEDGILIIISEPDSDTLVTDIGDTIVTDQGEVIELSH